MVSRSHAIGKQIYLTLPTWIVQLAFFISIWVAVFIFYASTRAPNQGAPFLRQKCCGAKGGALGSKFCNIRERSETLRIRKVPMTQNRKTLRISKEADIEHKFWFGCWHSFISAKFSMHIANGILIRRRWQVSLNRIKRCISSTVRVFKTKRLFGLVECDSSVTYESYQRVNYQTDVPKLQCQYRLHYLD